MRISRTLTTAIAVTTLAGAAVIGCSSKTQPATPTSATPTTTSQSPTSTSEHKQPQATNYATLLIQASAINAPEIFTASPPTQNPNGQPGAATTFSNPDGTHVIVDTIQVLPDPAAAASALNARKEALDVTVHGTPEPIGIGTGGTRISGSSPDGSRGVTVVLFTEGRAFVELEFDGPPSALVPPDFVEDIGQKQDAAIKQGLNG